MGKIGKYLALTAVLLVLTGCPPPCSPVHLDYGDLSDEVIEMIPYKDGESYGFRHSAGQEINFLAHRDTSTVTEYWDDCMQVTYGNDLTLMIPDYPVFNLRIEIFKSDTAIVTYHASIGASHFILPLTVVYNPESFSKLDSAYFNEQWFREVYELTPFYTNQNMLDQINADSLWFNTDFGILKFTMSNGAYYEINQ